MATAKLSVSRSDRLQLPRPWAPALKYGASTGVYCRGQRYGNKGPPLRWGQSPRPQRAQGLQEHHIWLSHFIAKKTEPKKKNKTKNYYFLFVRYDSHAPSFYPHNSPVIKAFSSAIYMHTHICIFFRTQIFSTLSKS